ncbi:unnamed protein product [Adineta ricciae]|uniref:N-formylglutamate amidohydrolase n=1 Tax=Adineta ricciae TaxID=249248 RepID=A0A815AK43_ADIRI|nr:unnamed protein product [Adineta ricciae]CAF1258559.1 unnamed protein product [Adineta ricciae]
MTRLNLANLNLIVSSPHAGSEIPNGIPDRSPGGCRHNSTSTCTYYYNDTCADGVRCPVTTVQDFGNWDPLAELIVKELHETYGVLPFAVVANWNRKNIDFNREIVQATFQHPIAIKAYHGYHGYIERAIKKINKKFDGKGLLIDLHQHAQGKYTMVGMSLSGVQLNTNNLSCSSIERLIELSCPDDRSDCICGSKAFGTFLESNGLGTAYPSLNNPKPENKTFYQGGYITNHYSSKINAIQTELSFVVS